MAIFRAETKSLSRAKGHNIVAAISYRAGIALTDNNELNPTATTHDYTKKTDVVHSEILMPKLLKTQLDDAEIKLDFQYIADLVEQGETTKRGKMKNSARLAREWVLCGVPELSRAENIALFQKFATEQGEEQGVVSMCFVHDPKAGNDTRSKSGAADATAKDERNVHAHIVLLTRKLELTDTNTLKLGAKSDSELSNDERTRPVMPENLVGTTDLETGLKIQQGRGLCSNTDWLKNTRKLWADMLNEKLLEKGVQPVSHLSYRELGLDVIPKIHVGNDELSDKKRTYNDNINRRNASFIKSAASSSTNKASERITFAAISCYNSTESRDTRKRAANERQSKIDTTVVTVSSSVQQRAVIRQKIDETDANIRKSERAVDRARGAINTANVEYDRAAEFSSDQTGVVSRRKQRVREREQLITSDSSDERRNYSGLKAASNCYERNFRHIASKLAWRNEESKNYDDRQKSVLDTFYRTLNIPNFSGEMADYVQPQLWTDTVQNALTDKHIIENPHIIAIVLDPTSEKAKYDAKTSHSASNSKVVVNTTLDNKASNTAAQTHIATNNNKRRL